jgi:hypothetical protein
VLVRLATPYADTTAADLCFALGLPAQPALHVLSIDVGNATTLELRLLGASHQVRVNDLSETVACLPDRPPSLPSTVDHGGYRFTARVHRLAPAAFARTVAALQARAADDHRALVGVFPGSAQAVTILAAHRKGWRTWHAYPQSGELVETATEVEA